MISTPPYTNKKPIGLNVKDLLTTFKPKSYKITPFDQRTNDTYTNRLISTASSTIKAIQIFKDYVNRTNSQYDYVILTRFDLVFYIKLSQMGLEKGKCHISCLTERPSMMDDNFFVMTTSQVVTYMGILMRRNKSDLLHADYGALRQLVGEDKIRFIVSGYYEIGHGTPLYHIYRGYISSAGKYLMDGNYAIRNANLDRFLSATNPIEKDVDCIRGLSDKCFTEFFVQFVKTGFCIRLRDFVKNQYGGMGWYIYCERDNGLLHTSR